MQAMCRRQCPRRIKYQPHEMKIVLKKLSDAFIAGRSDMVIAYDIYTTPLLQSSPSASAQGLSLSDGITPSLHHSIPFPLSRRAVALRRRVERCTLPRASFTLG